MTNASKPEPISYEEYQAKVANLKTLSDVTDFAKSLVAPTLQAMLEGEMEEHLGYPKNARTTKKNSRNGSYKKKVKTSMGDAQIQIPRDRDGSYEPLVVRKYETVESDVEERIVAMYAKGLTTRDIASYMKDIYGVEVSSTMVSRITDKVMPLVREWQNRPLESVYVAVYLDGMFYKVREGGKIVKKCAYIALGITQTGIKEVLGIWTADTEGAKFWMGVCNELKNRGVEDIFIACIDGLKGFGDAIRAIFPDVQVQRCVVHMIRNTTKYVPHKHKKAFCQSLRTVYTAPTEEAAMDALEQVKTDWEQYAVYLQRWEDNWDELSPMFGYPEPIRRIMYTTNIIESLNRQLRKVTKTTTIFPHEEALQKLLWLAQDSVSRKWTMPVRNWGEIVPQLAILFPNRFSL